MPLDLINQIAPPQPTRAERQRTTASDEARPRRDSREPRNTEHKPRDQQAVERDRRTDDRVDKRQHGEAGSSDEPGSFRKAIDQASGEPVTDPAAAAAAAAAALLAQEGEGDEAVVENPLLTQGLVSEEAEEGLLAATIDGLETSEAETGEVDPLLAMAPVEAAADEETLVPVETQVAAVAVLAEAESETRTTASGDEDDVAKAVDALLRSSREAVTALQEAPRPETLAKVAKGEAPVTIEIVTPEKAKLAAGPVKATATGPVAAAEGEEQATALVDGEEDGRLLKPVSGHQATSNQHQGGPGPGQQQLGHQGPSITSQAIAATGQQPAAPAPAEALPEEPVTATPLPVDSRNPATAMPVVGGPSPVDPVPVPEPQIGGPGPTDQLPPPRLPDTPLPPDPVTPPTGGDEPPPTIDDGGGIDEDTANIQRQVVRALFSQMANGDRALTLRLTPPMLGTMRIELVEHQGSLNLRFHIEDDKVRQVVERQLPQLRQDLRLVDAPVASVQLDDGGANTFHQGQHQGHPDAQTQGGRGQAQGQTFDLAHELLASDDDDDQSDTSAAGSLGGIVNDTVVNARA